MLPDPGRHRNILHSEPRLRAVEVSGLLSAAFSAFHQSILLLASRTLDSPVALLNAVAADGQHVSSELNLPEPFRTLRQMPLSHSLCQFVVSTDAPLALPDLLDCGPEPQRFEITALSFRAYLGAPIRGLGNETLGALCVLDHEPRTWTKDDTMVLEALADCVADSLIHKNEKMDLTSASSAHVELSDIVRTNLDLLTVHDFRTIILRLREIQQARRPHKQGMH